MEPRFDLPTDVPEVFEQLYALDETARKALGDDTLHLLVKVRASLLNGCAFCLDRHATHLARVGEDWRRILAVASWRESSFFSAAERAALDLTDAVTDLGADGVPAPVWDQAVAEHGLVTATDLVVVIALINTWNRLLVAGHALAPTLDAPAPGT